MPKVKNDNTTHIKQQVLCNIFYPFNNHRNLFRWVEIPVADLQTGKETVRS